MGSLKSLVITQPTLRRYEGAFKCFLQYLHSQLDNIAPTRQALDIQLQDYLDYLWQEGESISLAGDTISSIQHYQPNCKRHLPGSWRLLKAWQLHELPARTPPFVWATLTVLLGWFHGQCPAVALGLYLAFRALLRTGELLHIQAKDVVLSPTSSHAVLYLGITKTGSRNPLANSVTLTDDHLVHLLRLWLSTSRHHDYLIPWSASYFRAQFNKGLEQTGLSKWGYKPYSLRRGGATDLWLTSHNYSRVAHAGRWSSERTLRIYIQDSLAMLTNINFTPSLFQRRLAASWEQHSRVEPPQMWTHRERGKKRRRTA